MGRRATLQTIADEVGVSRATVSNAYNRPDQLGAELRERILQTARRLGYPGPDPAGRTLRTGKAGAVGVLLTERLSYAFTDAAAVAFLEGFSRRCELADSALLLLPLAPGATEAQSVMEAVADGIAIYSLPDGHPSLNAALDRGLPVVVVDEPKVDGTAWVGIDDRRAARELAEHVAGLGHRRAAVIALTHPPLGERHVLLTRYRVDRERLAGYREALARVGVVWADVPVAESANNEESGAAAARELLAADPRPTVLLAGSDRVALGAMRAARQLGLSVPRDLSITGFDDIPEAALADPPLTTARQPLVEKGEVAGRLLFELIEGGHATDQTLPAELVVRESTGPAPRQHLHYTS